MKNIVYAPNASQLAVKDLKGNLIETFDGNCGWFVLEIDVKTYPEVDVFIENSYASKRNEYKNGFNGSQCGLR